MPGTTLRSCRTARFVAAYVFAFFACSAISTAHATIRCVSDFSTLVSAFDDANGGPEGGTWDIRIRPGTYKFSGNLVFIPAGDHDNKQFFLSGGWDSSCSNQTINPAATILRGDASTADTKGSQFLFEGNNNLFDIENLRFENFSEFIISDFECFGLNICPDTAYVRIEYAQFHNGENISLVTYDANRLVFTGNLVDHMQQIHCTDSSIACAPVEFNIFKADDAPDISFNTFADLHCLATLGGVMMLSRHPGPKLHHNIFQTVGCQDDIYITNQDGGQPATPWNNLFYDIGGSYFGAPSDNGNVIAVDPKFVNPGTGNYRLQNLSPAVNAGMTVLESVQHVFFAPGYDLDGGFRPTGLHYDIGAYESQVNDGAPATLEVTNTHDSGAGSLRQAITKANSQIATAQTITFNIPGACPQIIYLDGPLPDITDSLFVDGYSQPGASPNTLDLGSDATLCIVLAPAGSGVPQAFQVPTGGADDVTLVLDGLAFGSSLAQFTTAAVSLRSGSGHVVSGSAFGGALPSDVTQLGSIEHGVLIRGTAKNVTIGGSEPRSRNTFGNLNNNAIVITDNTTSGHTIENNYIGVAPNGLAAQANLADGISATGGSDVTILGNSIAASVRGIYLSGAATKNFTIKGNHIGVNAAGFGVSQHANHVGIEIGGGSGQHMIGYAPDEDIAVGQFSNYIGNNATAGVLLDATAGAGITIRGNLIEGNGRSGSGLGIDLASLGRLPNDPGDGDTGPNLSQNYPVIKGSAPSGANRTVDWTLHSNANSSFRIDFYRSALCPLGGNTGANATTWVGSINVSTGSLGFASFPLQVAGTGAPAYLTATATSLPAGNTSELAPCFAEDTIFADGHELD